MGSNKGFLAPEQDVRGCVTVGLTIGFQVEAQMNMLPTKEHHKIREALPACEVKPRQCVQGIEPAKDHFLGFRARTPTSTSMVNVVSQDVVGSDGSLLSQDQVWESIEQDFDISPGSVWDLRERFQANLPDILLDAIAGLCKDGHSCRYSSKAMLMKLLKEAVAAPEPIAPIEEEEQEKKQEKKQEDNKQDAIQQYLESLKERQQKNYAASQAAQTAANTKLVLFPELNKNDASDTAKNTTALGLPSSAPNRTISKLVLAPSSNKIVPLDSPTEANETNATQVPVVSIPPIVKDTDWASRAQAAKARTIQLPEKNFLHITKSNNATSNSTGMLASNPTRVPQGNATAVALRKTANKTTTAAPKDSAKVSPKRALAQKPTNKPKGVVSTKEKEKPSLQATAVKAGTSADSPKADAKKLVNNKDRLRGSQKTASKPSSK